MKFLNQSGFSIIQGMLIAGAVAGMGYVGTRMITDQILAQKGIQSRDNVEQLHDMVYAILQNKDNCTATFVAENLNTDASWTSAANETLPAIYTHNAASPTTPAKVFEVNNSASYDGSKSYMNNSVTIDSMTLIKPAGLNFANPAAIEVVYRKIDTAGNKRLGKGYGGQTLKKSLPIKIQRDVQGDAFVSCYAVSTGDTDQLSKDFCEQIGQSDGNAATADSMFTWDADHQQCVFKDLKCPAGQVFSGIDSTGARRCHLMQDWTSFANFIDPTSATCNPATASSVRFVQVGDKVKIDCGSTSGCTPVPASTTCPSAASLGPTFTQYGNVANTGWTSSYGLPAALTTITQGSGSTCWIATRNSTSCQEFRDCRYNNSAGTGCTPSTPCATTASMCPTAATLGPTFSQYANVDQASGWDTRTSSNPSVQFTEGVTGTCAIAIRQSTSCQSYRECRYTNSANTGCSPGGVSCSSSCDCPNMMDVCESGVCVDRSSGACIDGTLAKGDASCQFICNGGSWACGMSGPCGGHPPACCPRTGAMVVNCGVDCMDDGSGVNLCSGLSLQCY